MSASVKKILNGTFLEPGLDKKTKAKRLNQDIDFFKNFAVPGTIKVPTSVNPGFFSTVKKIFFKPKQPVLAHNVPKFSAQELKKFPLNRYNKSTPYPKDEIIFKNTFQNAKNASKTPLLKQMNGPKLTNLQEAYLANKIRPYAKAGGGLAAAGILEEVVSDAGTNKDSTIKPSTNKALRKNRVPIFNAKAIDDAAGGYYDPDDKSFIQPLNNRRPFNPNAVDDASGGYYDADDASFISPISKKVVIAKSSKPKTKNKKRKPITIKKVAMPVSRRGLGAKTIASNASPVKKLSVYNIMDADNGLSGKGIEW
jgi:hypothetical protein